jgi:Tol biopolymer transport system component
VSVNKIFHILACGAVLALLVCPAAAEPNPGEVKAARMLVPGTFSRDGAYDPAVSPDGKTVAFHATDGLYILHAEKLYEEKDLKPWKLEFDSPGPFPCASAYGGAEQARSADWSADGKRLAFLYDQRLWIAEDIDYQAKTGTVRMLANARVFGDEKGSTDSDSQPSARVLSNPRWSPDGKKIAVLRVREEEAFVSVIDVRSGEESIVARDGLSSSAGWNQPWSPDGQFLAFAAGACGKKRIGPTSYQSFVNDRRIDVVATDATSRRTLLKDSDDCKRLSSPSWSPISDQIAYVASGRYAFADARGEKHEGAKAMIWSLSASGKHKKTISSIRSSTPGYLARVSEVNKDLQPEMTKAIREGFEKEFGSSLTPDQRERLHQGKMSENEMQGLAMLISAKDIGGDFEHRIADIVNSPSWEKSGAEYSSRDMRDALANLNKRQLERFEYRVFHFLVLPLFEHQVWATSGQDACPACSPDGKSIAFVCGSRDEGSTLEILDVASGKQRTFFAADGEVARVTWAGDSRSLVFQSKRVLEGRPTNYGMTDATTSQPEIWMVEAR